MVHTVSVMLPFHFHAIQATSKPVKFAVFPVATEDI